MITSFKKAEKVIRPLLRTKNPFYQIPTGKLKSDKTYLKIKKRQNLVLSDPSVETIKKIEPKIESYSFGWLSVLKKLDKWCQKCEKQMIKVASSWIKYLLKWRVEITSPWISMAPASQSRSYDDQYPYEKVTNTCLEQDFLTLWP